MPTYPEEKSKSKSTGGEVRIKPTPGFGEYLPIVHTLTVETLRNDGWIRVGNVFMKGVKKVEHIHGKWLYNNQEVQFLEDLK